MYDPYTLIIPNVDRSSKTNETEVSQEGRPSALLPLRLCQPPQSPPPGFPPPLPPQRFPPPRHPPPRFPPPRVPMRSYRPLPVIPSSSAGLARFTNRGMSRRGAQRGGPSRSNTSAFPSISQEGSSINTTRPSTEADTKLPTTDKSISPRAPKTQAAFASLLATFDTDSSSSKESTVSQSSQPEIQDLQAGPKFPRIVSPKNSVHSQHASIQTVSPLSASPGDPAEMTNSQGSPSPRK